MMCSVCNSQTPLFQRNVRKQARRIEGAESRGVAGPKRSQQARTGHCVPWPETAGLTQRCSDHGAFEAVMHIPKEQST